MITRRFGFPRLHGVAPMQRDRQAGLIHVKIVDGQPHVWPVARPGGVYVANGTRHNLRVPKLNQNPVNELVRTNTPTLAMTQPHIAMDPSDSRTWQRPYLFT